MAEEYVSRAEYQQDMEELRRKLKRALELLGSPSGEGGEFSIGEVESEFRLASTLEQPSRRRYQWLKDYGVFGIIATFLVAFLGLGIPALFHLGGLHRQVQVLETQTRQLNTTVETVRAAITGLETRLAERLTAVETRVTDLGPRIDKMTLAIETLAAKIQGQGEGLAQVSGKLDVLVDVLRQQGRSGGQ